MSFVLTLQLTTEKEMRAFGAKLAQALGQQGGVIFLYGGLGAGKTTLVRGLMHYFGYQDRVKSPTFSLVETYMLQERLIHHFDLYRLQSPQELTQIGIGEYFSKEAVCLIEWPEKGGDLLSLPDLSCTLDFCGTGRLMRVEALTPLGEVFMQRLSS